MLGKVDYLLSCLSEECGEVVQAVGKSQRFGLYDTPRPHELGNFQQLEKEIHDIIAVYEELCEELGEDPDLNQTLISNKKVKLTKWMGYSRIVKRLK